MYGGPHAQDVQDRWGAASGLDHILASKGFLVWTMDNRGSWGRGHAFETPLLRNMGAQELKDQLEGVAELTKKPFVDGARLGIWGWSYGGYMTLFAVTHTDGTFKCALAGAPVTDWKLYDSIYTERYMKRPKDNPEGYEASSPLEAAKNLSTKLLVMHGTSDDNVHMQNSIDLPRRAHESAQGLRLRALAAPEARPARARPSSTATSVSSSGSRRTCEAVSLPAFVDRQTRRLEPGATTRMP